MRVTSRLLRRQASDVDPIGLPFFSFSATTTIINHLILAVVVVNVANIIDYIYKYLEET